MGTSNLPSAQQPSVASGYCTVPCRRRAFLPARKAPWAALVSVRAFSWQWVVLKSPWSVPFLVARPLTSQNVDQWNSTQCPACGQRPSH